ncbi:MAG: hypothetical protein ABII09_12680 [Planctomycetota bacterium]
MLNCGQLFYCSKLLFAALLISGFIIINLKAKQPVFYKGVKVIQIDPFVAGNDPKARGRMSQRQLRQNQRWLNSRKELNSNVAL